MIGDLEIYLNSTNAGDDMYGLIEELYPICRSITGNGVRQTLDLISKHIPIQVHEVPTGTRVFDWNVPKEWAIRDAFIKDSDGNRVVDFQSSNLHVVSYSTPIHETMTLEALRPHLFVSDKDPDWIPYRTSYYGKAWGFCLSRRQLESMKEDEYEVCIDATLEDGSLTYAEYVRQGTLDDEILLSCHICHPSMCNDNLSGIALVTQLAKYLETIQPRYSYRIVFLPATIGAISWLSINEDNVNKIKHGLVVSCVGDDGPFGYKRSRQRTARIDQIAEYVLERSGEPFKIVDFSPYGYDERQYCSPGFDLPVGRLTRSANGEYPEYHSSADNLDLISGSALRDSLRIYLSILNILEKDRIMISTNPKCEPQLGRRGLYRASGGDINDKELAMLWVLNLCDGRHSMFEIASRSLLPFEVIVETVDLLENQGLLKEF